MVSARFIERQRKDLQQVEAYAQAMMEKEFPSLGFPNERWARSMTDGAIVYIARWPCGSAVRITQEADLWNIALVDHDYNVRIVREAYQQGSPMPNVLKQEKNLDLLVVRCIAYDWTKHLTTTETKNGD